MVNAVAELLAIMTAILDGLELKALLSDIAVGLAAEKNHLNDHYRVTAIINPASCTLSKDKLLRISLKLNALDRRLQGI